MSEAHVDIAASPERVAQALHGARHLAVWFADFARAEPQPLGRVVLQWHDGRQAMGRWEAFDVAGTKLVARDDEGASGTLNFSVADVDGGSRVHVVADGIFDGAWDKRLAALKEYAEQGSNRRERLRPRMGVVIEPLDTAAAHAAGAPIDGGIGVRAVAEGTGAEAAGVTAGDVFEALDGRRVRTWGDLTSTLATHEAGDTVAAALWRAGARMEMPVALSAAHVPDLTHEPTSLKAEIQRDYERSATELRALMADVTADEAAFKPHPEEWSIEDVLGHLMVSERWSAADLAQALAGSPEPDWSEDVFTVQGRALAGWSAAAMAEHVIALTADVVAVAGGALQPDAPPWLVHAIAADRHHAQEHLGEHVSQMQANLAAARGQ